MATSKTINVKPASVSKTSRTPKAFNAASAGGQTEPRDAPSPSRVIKKYPNRRLYDTQTSTYITLSDVRQLVMGNVPFEVLDAKDRKSVV